MMTKTSKKSKNNNLNHKNQFKMMMKIMTVKMMRNDKKEDRLFES